MGAKNKRVFSKALEYRMAKIAAIKLLGWSWSAVAEHFENDYLIGGVTGNGFSAAWSRLMADGKKPNESAVQAALNEIDRAGGLTPGMWVMEFSNPPCTASPGGAEADVVRRMHMSARLAKVGK